MLHSTHYPGTTRAVWAWGSTGEEQWNPDMVIGVDWKSLTYTGLLPITTDFFPDGQTLADNYLMNDHSVGCRSVHLEKIGADSPGHIANRAALVAHVSDWQRLSTCHLRRVDLPKAD
jgi:hypothetical protein